MNTTLERGFSSGLCLDLFKNLLNSSKIVGPISLQTRNFGVSGSYGYSIFVGNRQTNSNIRLVELPKQEEDTGVKPNYNLKFMKWPENVNRLGGSYFHREGPKVPVSVYNMIFDDLPSPDSDCKAGNDLERRNICIVGSTDPNKIQTRTIENALYESTRGFASQIILQGRGVKAYFEPEWPQLRIRLGVGLKPLDASRVALRHAGDVKIFVDKTGSLITVHGWCKKKVGSIAYRLFKVVEANPYTLKGGHLPFMTPVQKVAKKR